MSKQPFFKASARHDAEADEWARWAVNPEMRTLTFISLANFLHANSAMLWHFGFVPERFDR